jgi:hypothetical protein
MTEVLSIATRCMESWNENDRARLNPVVSRHRSRARRVQMRVLRPGVGLVYGTAPSWLMSEENRP